MSTKEKQTSDSSQTGPGVGAGPTSRKGSGAPALGPAGNGRTGSSQGNKRGKQGNG